MPRTVRFHLDEHVHSAVADGLRRRGIDVTTTPDAGLLGAGDEVQLTSALSQNRVIVTSDPDFLRLNDLGAEHAGIAFYRQQERSIGDLIRGLELIWEILEPEEMRGRVEFL
jgi:predicted nuclease of predicted toxin-antitoxin system